MKNNSIDLVDLDLARAKSINSEFHTLFIEDRSERKIPVNDAEKTYQIIPKYRIFRVYISSFSEIKKGLHAVFNELRKAASNDHLELRINSGGGYVREGQQFFNVMLEKFSGRTTAYLDNVGYSMGALLFCMAEKRVIYPYSDLMFHDYAHGVMGKGGNVKSRVKHSSRTMKQFFHDIVVRQNFLTESEFKEMLLGKDFWMNAKEMCQRGIATHVVISGEIISAKDFLKLLKRKKKAEKKQAENSDQISEQKVTEKKLSKKKVKK
ncbi:MAG: ATP-dependent Clp protease proteolytic subunit [Methylococcales bacterium]|nr:ATP-dependent Clp protease proteolytic subunit [Methylococcales bacterium]